MKSPNLNLVSNFVTIVIYVTTQSNAFVMLINTNSLSIKNEQFQSYLLFKVII